MNARAVFLFARSTRLLRFARQSPNDRRSTWGIMPDSGLRFDAVVIGGGIGGLMAACRLGQAGMKVLLVEKLSFLGGRFTAFQVAGAEISSGAFHTIPHGDEGPFAQALRRLGICLPIIRPDVFAAFHRSGEQVVASNGFDMLRVVQDRADRRMIWRTFFHLWWRKDFPGSVADWLNHLGASLAVQRIFDRFCQFALSAGIEQVSYREGRAVAEAVIRYGLPGVPDGGAREVVHRLHRAALAARVTIWKTSQVERLLMIDGKVRGAVVHRRRDGRRVALHAPVVISSIGPQQTNQLVAQSGGTAAAADCLQDLRPAVGLKIHVLSPKSLLNHPAIMFCLDTQRIAGIIQITNTDPSLAPPGKHLLISHQVLPPGANWQAERALAFNDWRSLFGPDFDDCVVVGCSQFNQNFPVNWAVQGSDVRCQPFSDQGVWLVGDGAKPAGLMMVEGVAASAECVSHQILGLSNPSPWVPSKKQEIITWMKRFRNTMRGGYDVRRNA